MFEEIAQPLSPEYTEVLRALMKLQDEGYFPLPASGNITLHYDENGRLSKVVPSPQIRV
jgi:hypothetical protein|tara:strand:- start:194 stop:370 length:177 start_codon:yes stop_codon:yes gene_type:complete